jgi:hypothetical protein
MYAPVIAFLFFYSKDRKTLIKNIIILIAGTIVFNVPLFSNYFVVRLRIFPALPLNSHVIDQPRFTDMGGGEQAGGAGEFRQRLQRIGIAQLNVIHFIKSCFLQARHAG